MYTANKNIEIYSVLLFCIGTAANISTGAIAGTIVGLIALIILMLVILLITVIMIRRYKANSKPQDVQSVAYYAVAWKLSPELQEYCAYD